MRILLYTHEFPPFAGGAGVYTAGLAKGLSELGHEVTVVAPAYEEAIAQWDAQQPYTVDRMLLPGGRLTVLAGSIGLIRAWLHLRPDMTFVTDVGAQLAASLASLVFPFHAPYCITVHGSEIEWHFGIGRRKRPQALLMPVVRRFFARSLAIVCVSRATQEALLYKLPALGERVAVVHNGIDLDAFPPVTEEEVGRQRNKIDAPGPVLLTVARLIPEKGIDNVLKALSRIAPDMPDLRYVVVGAGPDLGRLKAQVTDSSLEGNVVFAGKVSQRELSAYYALCDIFIMPSRPSDRFEGFGLVYAEAGAYGKPVIAGRTGGVPEVVQDGHNGILVDPMDVDGLERAIRSLLSNPGLARSMGCNGRRQVVERFNILRMAESTLQVVCEREGRPKHGGGPGA